MKNGVKRYKDFFPYFKALKTNCGQSNLPWGFRKNLVAFSEYMNFKSNFEKGFHFHQLFLDLKTIRISKGDFSEKISQL